MLVGYARVSTQEQDLTLQLDALYRGVRGEGLWRAARAASTSGGARLMRQGDTLVFHIFAALAEFERGVIRERIMAGLQAARARGRTGSRPSALAARTWRPPCSRWPSA